MQFQSSGLGLFVSICVAMTALIISVGVMYLCRHTLRATLRNLSVRLGSKYRTRAVEASERFKTDLSEFREKMAQLDPYAPEYHHSFSSGGWGWLVSISEHLSVAERLIDNFMEAGRYQDAFTLSAFLNGDLAHAEMPLAAQRFADFVDLLDWKARTKEQMLKLLDLVHEGASLNKEIGLKRARTRKPTILTLSELKRDLQS